MAIIIIIVIIIVIPYLMGSIPFDLLITKLAGYGDISATNVKRTDSKNLALLILLLNFLKSYIPLNIIALLGYDQNYGRCAASLTEVTIGIFIILGHVFSVGFKSKDEKGVVTTIGVIAALNPSLALCFVILWLIIFMISGFYSFSSLTAFAGTTLLALTPLSTITVGNCNLEPFFFSMMLIISGIIFSIHRSNIKRLRNGTEPKWDKTHYLNEL